MNRILYENRCKCKEKLIITKKRRKTIKKRKRKSQTESQYPTSTELFSKTFHIKSNKSLSLKAKLIFNTFQNKYVYHAMDDILYIFYSKSEERDYLLEVLYSAILSLQNNFLINFFDIWINEIYIEKLSKSNRFLNDKNSVFTQDTFITMKFFYKIPLPLKKQESLW